MSALNLGYIWYVSGTDILVHMGSWHSWSVQRGSWSNGRSTCSNMVYIMTPNVGQAAAIFARGRGANTVGAQRGASWWKGRPTSCKRLQLVPKLGRVDTIGAQRGTSLSKWRPNCGQRMHWRQTNYKKPGASVISIIKIIPFLENVAR